MISHKKFGQKMFSQENFRLKNVQPKKSLVKKMFSQKNVCFFWPKCFCLSVFELLTQFRLAGTCHLTLLLTWYCSPCISAICSFFGNECEFHNCTKRHISYMRWITSRIIENILPQPKSRHLVWPWFQLFHTTQHTASATTTGIVSF